MHVLESCAYHSRSISNAFHTFRRAFSRLLDRVLKVTEDLSQLKEEKSELFRATYAAVRGEKTPDAAAAAASDDIFGRQGPLRVSLDTATINALCLVLHSRTLHHMCTSYGTALEYVMINTQDLFCTDTGAGERGCCFQSIYADP